MLRFFCQSVYISLECCSCIIFILIKTKSTSRHPEIRRKRSRCRGSSSCRSECHRAFEYWHWWRCVLSFLWWSHQESTCTEWQVSVNLLLARTWSAKRARFTNQPKRPCKSAKKKKNKKKKNSRWRKVTYHFLVCWTFLLSPTARIPLC